MSLYFFHSSISLVVLLVQPYVWIAGTYLHILLLNMNDEMGFMWSAYKYYEVLYFFAGVRITLNNIILFGELWSSASMTI